MERGPINVLLIEDDPATTEIVKGLIGEDTSMFRLECAGRLQEGLDRLTAGAIDLVLLDFGLPDSEGL
ncbi:MAG: response regulator, partial [Blastocatellia bacterium]